MLDWLADLANASLTDYLACGARAGSLPLCCTVNHFRGVSLFLGNSPLLSICFILSPSLVSLFATAFLSLSLYGYEK